MELDFCELKLHVELEFLKLKFWKSDIHLNISQTVIYSTYFDKYYYLAMEWNGIKKEEIIEHLLLSVE